MKSFRLFILVVSVLAIAPHAYGQVTSQRIRGDVVAVHGKDLDVKTSVPMHWQPAHSSGRQQSSSPTAR